MSIFSFQLQICHSFQHSTDNYPIPQNDENIMRPEFLISQQSQASFEALPGSVSSENNVQTFHYRTQTHLNTAFQMSTFTVNSEEECQIHMGIWVSQQNYKQLSILEIKYPVGSNHWTWYHLWFFNCMPSGMVCFVAYCE